VSATSVRREAESDLRWRQRGVEIAPIASCLHARALAALDRLPLAFPETADDPEAAAEMKARLEGLVPSLGWFIWHHREIGGAYQFEVEETLCRAEAIR
jgi:hypothetical protein